MKHKFLTLGVIASMALAGCASIEPDNSSAATSATASEAVQTNVKNWTVSDEKGAQLIFSADVKGPEDVLTSYEFLTSGTKELSYLAVTIDNRSGEEPYQLNTVNFTSPDGTNVEYKSILDFINPEEADLSNLTTAQGKYVAEVSKRFSEEKYRVAKGEKTTLYLASEKPYITEIVKAYMGNQNLTASTEGADVSLAAEPIVGENLEARESTSSDSQAEGYASSSSANVKKRFSGTTLKGNDVTFLMLTPAQQQELHRAGSGGSWGLLCSGRAVHDQLVETGVLSKDAGGTEYIWRSLNYTSAELGYSPESHDSVANKIASIASVEFPNLNCVGVNTNDPNAASKAYGNVVIGQYDGISIINSISAR